MSDTLDLGLQLSGVAPRCAVVTDSVPRLSRGCRGAVPGRDTEYCADRAVSPATPQALCQLYATLLLFSF